MKGITPVIAIILILVLSVFAVGGMFLFYRSFQEDTTDSSREAQSELFKQTGSKLLIESVSDSVIYVRNVGTENQDISYVSIYVDGRPLLTSTSDTTLKPNDWAEFQIEEDPGCVKDSCTVSVLGIDSTKKIVDSIDFNCTQNPECFRWESCYCRQLYFADTFSKTENWVDKSSGGSSFSITSSTAQISNGYGADYKYNIPPYNTTNFFVRIKARSPDAGTCIITTDEDANNTWQVSPAATFTVYNLTKTNSDIETLVSKINLTSSATCELEYIELVKS